MKNLILINGTMGIGKTAVSNELLKILPNCVFLDGDWCWYMRPFIVTDETKAMVLDNIAHLLNNFIQCSEFENIIFCWVMHEQNILDDLLSRLKTSNCSIHIYTIVCTETALKARLKKDIKKGLRTKDIIGKSLSRLSNYDSMNTIKIDVSGISAEQAAQLIRARLFAKEKII